MAKPGADEKPISLRMLFGESVVQQEMLLFVVVSAMDVLMTVRLLYLGDEDRQFFFESNPVARFFLREWGIRGMIYFKFAMVAFVCVLSQIIAQHKPAVARRLLVGATGIVAVVVIYSLFLFLQLAGSGAMELTAM
jgi:hypothetical protein